MKRILIVGLLYFITAHFNFAEAAPDCVADLSKEKVELEKVINQLDDKYKDKKKLQDLPALFKKCVTMPELKNIQKVYLGLKFDAPQRTSYTVIIKKILEKEGLLSVNFVNNRQQGVNKNFVKELNVLIGEYEKLKTKNTKEKTYEGSEVQKNYTILNAIKPLLSERTTPEQLNEIINLINELETANFGQKTKDFKVQILDLIQNFNKELLDYKEVVEEEEPEETSSSEEEIPEEEKEGGTSIFMYLLYVLLLGGFAYGAFEFYKRYTKAQKAAKEKEAKAKNFNSESNMIYKKEIKDLKRKNDELHEKNVELQRKNAELAEWLEEAEAEIKKFKGNQSEGKVENNSPKIIALTKKPKSKRNKGFNYEEVLFFATPSAQGEFINKLGQNKVKSGASIYKFYVKGAEAEFEFYNDPSTFRATINDPGNRIKPVCDAKNAYNPDAKRIVTVKKGKAILQNNTWKVTDKAEIRYEG